jgi:hypothetical protein
MYIGDRIYNHSVRTRSSNVYKSACLRLLERKQQFKCDCLGYLNFNLKKTDFLRHWFV